MWASALEKAFERGLKAGGNLYDEILQLGDFKISSRRDAKAICKVLKRFPLAPSKVAVITSPLHAVVGLFQSLEGPERDAFDILLEDGIPELVRIFDRMIESCQEHEADDLLFLVKILAMYGSRAGADRIVVAARKPLKPDGYTWNAILSTLSKGHPQLVYVFNRLRDPLPEGFIAIALLDAANRALLDGEEMEHPFDLPAGKKQLEAWIRGEDPDLYSYASSATTALPFISKPERDRLLTVAMDHPSPKVQLEASWVAAKMGKPTGLDSLRDYCLDTNLSEMAREYLTELGRDDLVPKEALDPAFKAKAEFARWLAHPTELGRPPDELHVVDHREFAWPPDGERKHCWLIRYRLKDDTGLAKDDVECGMVGSITFCLFTSKLHQRPPEDGYAIHCAWEMEGAGLIREIEPDNPKEYLSLLHQWRGKPLENAKIVRVAESSTKLVPPAGLIGIAEARCSQADGWAVLDGPRSEFYPRDHFPEGTWAHTVLQIHIGRRLLKLAGNTDRMKFLSSDPSEPDPAQIVRVYEGYLREAESGLPKRRQELLSFGSSPLNFFDKYIKARALCTGEPLRVVTRRAFERLLSACQANKGLVGSVPLESFTPLGNTLDQYIDGLIETRETSEVEAVIKLFSPHWNHNLGYGRLGSAAFRAGLFELAETYFLKLRDSLENSFTASEMGLLARIWHQSGRIQEACSLLTDCLLKTTTLALSEVGSARSDYEEKFQAFRTTFLDLFPNKGTPELKKLGIPESVAR